MTGVQTCALPICLDGKYFIIPKSADCVKIKASINDADGVLLFDAYSCLYESLISWEAIFSKFR